LSTVFTSKRFGPTKVGRKKYRRMVLLAHTQGGMPIKGRWAAPCFYCRWWFLIDHLTFEHLRNRSEGGTNAISNLALACYECNQYRCQMEALRSSRYPGLTGKMRQKVEAWLGFQLFFLNVPALTDYPELELPCIAPSIRTLQAAFFARQEPFKPK
jgi:hypothetical protein